MRPPLRTTHTVAEMEVTPACYDEIRNRLTAVSYDHCFMEDGTIDMTGIGLTRIKVDDKVYGWRRVAVWGGLWLAGTVVCGFVGAFIGIGGKYLLEVILGR